MFRFAHPQALFLLLLIPAACLVLRGRNRGRSVAYSSLDLIEAAGMTASAWKRWLVPVLGILALVLIVAGVAGPQNRRTGGTIESEGIDIVLLLDTSSSMQAQDFKPRNRLHVAKEVVKKFITQRKNDRIGLVVFAAQSITQCPLTLDYDILQDLVDRVEFGMLEDGTAIGTALATACNRLKDSKAKSRVVILLTDGRNNMGIIAPVTAAEVAQSLGIKVYTVGVGTRGPVPVPVDDPLFGRRTVPMEMELDEDTLKEIAQLTDGEYFHATAARELAEIYDRIDELEKTKIESKTFTSYTDRFAYFVLPALALLLLRMGLDESVLRRIP
ncbi:MAG: VWA domain-containing protein [Candidatus Krumholzibacteriia bacterium]